MTRDISFLGKDFIAKLEKEFASKAVDLGTKIQHQMAQEIQSEVYDKYTPKQYVRKGIHGGLQDVNNMPLSIYSKIGGNGISFEIGSRRKDEKTGRDISALVEGGDGTNGMYYFKKTGKSAKKPRRFVRSTYLKMRMPVRNYLANMIKKVIKDINNPVGS